MTPIQAFENGSDWLVLGRSITKGSVKKNLNKLINNISQ